MDAPPFTPKITHVKGSNLVIGHSKVIQIAFSGGKHDQFTKANIIYEVEKLRKSFKGKSNLVMMVSVDTPQGYRSGREFTTKKNYISGKQFRKGEDINLPEDYDFEDVDSFVVFVWEDKTTKGGNDLNNDCLYNAISKLITTYRLPKQYKTPEALKTYLGIDRTDKIDISFIPKIEDLLKININVAGDHVFTSPMKHDPITIHLTLIDGHYDIDKAETIKSSLLKGVPKRTTKLVLCLEGKENVELYDGENKYVLDYEDYFTEKRDNKQNSYINQLKEEIKTKGIEKAYRDYLSECEKMKEETKGKIDMARSGYKVSNEALKSLSYSLQSFNEPEPITEQEQRFLFNSTKGALIFSSPCELENAVCYDKNSAYPDAMSNNHFTFPILEGEFTRLEELPPVFNYGIYRVEIERSGDEMIDRLFRFNDLHYYTHYDLQTARELGFRMELIKDDEANALLYTKARANGGKYFKETINSLYKLKKKSKIAKRILSAMWGALCEKNKIKRTTRKPIELNNGETILNIEPLGNDIKITYTKGKFYKHDYARIGTFLLAKVRRDMMNTIKPYNNEIVRFHTDGFISKIPLPLDLGDDLGKWKIEKQGNVKITNSCKVEWNI